ncbi:MAG TPA: sugar transferase [Waddliaceae bacterium]
METINHLETTAIPSLVLSKSFRCPIKHIPLKRTFDIVFSLLVLLLTSPLFLLIATTIRLTSKGKAIYSQERIGRGGKRFRCYKFRTMYANADFRLKELLDSDLIIMKEWQETFKLKKDPRITPFGRFLRKTSLDELPQFWNTLKGDLSVVGPRPVVHDEIAKHYGIKAAKILSIRPGITGIWQVSGRNDVCYKTRIGLDEKYVDDHSFLLDLKLVFKTIPAMILSKGAY